MEKPTRYYSNRQEKQIAKEVGGRQVAGSGASDFQKGDVKREGFLIEAKTKVEPCKSMKIEKEWFTKAKQQAFQMRKPEYAVAFSFGDGENYYAVDSFTFRRMADSLSVLDRIIELVEKADNEELSDEISQIIWGDK